MLPQAEIHCYCRHRPLLGIYGIDQEGHLYVHVKVYKGGKIYAEVITKGDGATSQIRCRECERWFSVVIHELNPPELLEIKDPTIGTSRAPAANGCGTRPPLRKVTPQ